jgi:hypothetical protein
MATITEAATELDVTEDAVSVIADQLADDPDLYDSETGEISDAGMDLIRAQFADGDDNRTGLLDDVVAAAEAFRRADEAADEALRVRDAAIRDAVAYGHKRTHVAKAGEISRERLYQIIGSTR